MAETEELTSLEREQPAAAVPGSDRATSDTSEDEGTLTSTDGDSETTPQDEEAKKAEEAKAAAEARKARTKKRIKDLAAENRALKERLESQGVTSSQAQPGDGGKPPKASDFDDYESFDAARRQYEVQQAINAERLKEAQQRERRAAEEAHQTFVEKWTNIAETAAEKYEDGEDAIEHFTSEAKVYPVAAQALVESDVGADVVYHLATNPKELEAFEKLSPFGQARRIGFLEAKIAQEEAKKAEGSGAPPPPSRPGQSRQGSNPNWKSDPKTDTGDWIARRQKEVHRR